MEKAVSANKPKVAKPPKWPGDVAAARKGFRDRMKEKRQREQGK